MTGLPRRPLPGAWLAAIFAVSGVVHLVAPRIYEPIVPRWVPRRRAVVLGSGVVELACAGGLAARRRWAAPLSLVTLAGVWPANIQMAVDATRAGRPVPYQAAVWLRVPLQVPMLRAALAARRHLDSEG